jgi:signal transduction histidine kinase
MEKDNIFKIDNLQKIDQLNIRLSALSAISKIISDSLDLEEMLSRIVDKILDTPDPESVSIYLLNDGEKRLKLAAHKRLSANVANHPFMKPREPGNALLIQILLGGEPKVIENTPQTIGPYVDFLIEEGFQSTVYIPLATKETSIGVMCVSTLNPSRLSSEFIEFLTVIGNYIAVAVDNATMHQNIKKAYQDLKEIQEQIVWTEKLASLGKLAATIAHEINNPLAGVLNYIRLIIKQLARNQFSHEKLEDISRYLKIMESETARCTEIVKDLLAFARRTKITMESNSIENIINKTLNLISRELEMKELQLIKNISPDLPKVKCDFKQIQQVLLNLLYNASESMPNGGTLTITANKANEAKTFLEVAVSDTGCGISETDMENIFEPFFTTKEEGKGVGLGLSVVYGIIAKHHGTITVESEPGRGSTFKVRLPCS